MPDLFAMYLSDMSYQQHFLEQLGLDTCVWSQPNKGKVGTGYVNIGITSCFEWEMQPVSFLLKQLWG